MNGTDTSDFLRATAILIDEMRNKNDLGLLPKTVKKLELAAKMSRVEISAEEVQGWAEKLVGSMIAAEQEQGKP